MRALKKPATAPKTIESGQIHPEAIAALMDLRERIEARLSFETAPGTAILDTAE